MFYTSITVTTFSTLFFNNKMNTQTANDSGDCPVFFPDSLLAILNEYVRPVIDKDFGVCLGSRIDDDMLGLFAHLAGLSYDEATDYAFEKKLTDPDFKKSFMLKMEYKRFCHSLVTLDLVMFLWSFMKDMTVMSVASGGAHLEYILYKMGIDIQCSDIDPPPEATMTDNRDFAIGQIVHDIAASNPEVKMRHSDEMLYEQADIVNIINSKGTGCNVIFMSWLPPDSNMSVKALNAVVRSALNETKYMVLLGEYGQGETCGTKRFRENLDYYQDSGRIVKVCEMEDEILLFPGQHDKCTIYMIKPKHEIQTEEPQVVTCQHEIQPKTPQDEPPFEKFADYINGLNIPSEKDVQEFIPGKTLSGVEDLLSTVLCSPCLESHDEVCKMAHLSEEFHKEVSAIIPNFELVAFLLRVLKGKRTFSLLKGSFVMERLLQLLGCDILKTDDADFYKGIPEQTRKILITFANLFRFSNPQISFDEKVGPTFCDCDAEDAIRDPKIFNDGIDVVIFPPASNPSYCARILMRLVAKARNDNRPIQFVLLGNYGLYGSHTSPFRNVLEEFMRTDTVSKVDRLGSDYFVVNFPNESNSCEVFCINPPPQTV